MELATDDWGLVLRLERQSDCWNWAGDLQIPVDRRTHSSVRCCWPKRLTTNWKRLMQQRLPTDRTDCRRRALPAPRYWPLEMSQSTCPQKVYQRSRVERSLWRMRMGGGCMDLSALCVFRKGSVAMCHFFLHICTSFNSAIKYKSSVGGRSS